MAEAKLPHANLSGANFFGANLVGADLSSANCSSGFFARSNLQGAQLSRANLSRADLTKADLSGANASSANLSGANFAGAILSGADLSRASLVGTNFVDTFLSDTLVSDARCDRTVFGSVDLRGLRGHDSVVFSGPCTLGIDALYRSQGNVPEAFQRGCGVPETFITFTRSLVGSALDFYSCFISYSVADQEFAERLHADLQGAGVRCWFAQEDVKIGDRFSEKIEESIKVYDKLLIILSKHAVKSDWVEREVAAASEKELVAKSDVLFPVRLDDAVMSTTASWAADLRRRRHIGDFSGWKEHDSYKKGLTRLLRDLKSAKTQ